MFFMALMMFLWLSEGFRMLFQGRVVTLWGLGMQQGSSWATKPVSNRRQSWRYCLRLFDAGFVTQEKRSPKFRLPLIHSCYLIQEFQLVCCIQTVPNPWSATPLNTEDVQHFALRLKGEERIWAAYNIALILKFNQPAAWCIMQMTQMTL